MQENLKYNSNIKHNEHMGKETILCTAFNETILIFLISKTREICKEFQKMLMCCFIRISIRHAFRYDFFESI